MKKSSFIILAALTALLSSCAKEYSDGTLRFIVKTRDTKASIVTSASIQVDSSSFILDAILESDNRGHTVAYDDVNPLYIDSAKVTLKDGVWSGDHLTWRNIVWTNFWAAYPVGVTGRSGLSWPAPLSSITDDQEKTPSFTYDMTSYSGSAEASLSAPDLLVGYCRGKWNEDDKTGSVVKFEMQHAMAAIFFSVVYEDEGCSIQDVTFAGIHYKGTCTLSGSTENLKDTVSMLWTYNDSPSTSVGFKCDRAHFSPTDFLFLMPQQLDEPAVLRATVNKEGSIETKEVTLSGYTWKPGYRYGYSLTFYKEKDELAVSTSVYQTSTGEWTD